jgi:hypothetical protein
MRKIIASKDPESDLSSDHVCTDLLALDSIIDEWQTSLNQGTLH